MYLPRDRVPNEVVVVALLVVEKVDEEALVSHKAACDEGVLEVIARHRVVVDLDQLIEADLVAEGLFLGLLLISEHAQFEQAVVYVGASVSVTSAILLDFLHLYEAVGQASILLHIGLPRCFQVIHHYP